jgi:hydrogenase maturation protease
VAEPLFIGLGNRFRGDDAAGLVCAELLKETCAAGSVITFEGEPLDLIELWQGAAEVVLVDAVSSGVAPGTIHHFVIGTVPLPANLFQLSSHAYSLGQTIELARALAKLPARLTVYGIEGSSFAMGEELSSEVSKAIIQLVEQICGQ